MRMVYDRVSLEIDYPTLMQGTGPRNALLDEFRATPQLRPVRHFVLLAGRGRAGRSIELRYHRQAALRGAQRSGGGSAHRDASAKTGGNPFYDYQIPQAALALKQGFGRLIRSKIGPRRAGLAG